MTSLYVISIVNANGQMQSFGVAASTRAKAEAEAQRLAGVGAGVEPQTSQNLHVIDSVVAD